MNEFYNYIYYYIFNEIFFYKFVLKLLEDLKLWICLKK